MNNTLTCTQCNNILPIPAQAFGKIIPSKAPSFFSNSSDVCYEDALREFIKIKCVVGNDAYYARSRDLHRSFSLFCQTRGMDSPTIIHMGRMMAKIVPRKKLKGERCYLQIRLKTR